MKFMLKTLGISLVLAIAGCANNGSATNPSLSAADDTPACASSCSAACKAACTSKAKAKTCGADCTKSCCASAKPSLGASDDAPSCSQKASSCCPPPADHCLHWDAGTSPSTGTTSLATAAAATRTGTQHHCSAYYVHPGV